MVLSVIVAGVGGQGSILASHILSTAAIQTAQSKGEHIDVRVGEIYGAAMRGGAVSSHVRIGGTALLTREDRGDVILALEPLEGLRVGLKYLSPTGIALVNTRPIVPVDVKLGRAKYPTTEEITAALKELGSEVYSFDATELAIKAGNSRSMNTVMIGALCALKKLPIDEDILLRVITEQVPPKAKEVNVKAFELGMHASHQFRSVQCEGQ